MVHIMGKNTTSSLTNVQQKDIQPNAVDLRVGKIFQIIDDNDFTIDEEQKIHKGSEPVPVFEDGFWYLYQGAYEIIMENEIEVGHDECGFVSTRSSLNRNGVFLTSGLYDSGYKGVMAGVIHIRAGRMKIKPGTRVGQFLCFKSETMGSYDGDYGTGKEHDKRYTD
jgi:deoxycytidine triphosphate deaminase